MKGTSHRLQTDISSGRKLSVSFFWMERWTECTQHGDLRSTFEKGSHKSFHFPYPPLYRGPELTYNFHVRRFTNSTENLLVSASPFVPVPKLGGSRLSSSIDLGASLMNMDVSLLDLMIQYDAAVSSLKTSRQDYFLRG